MGNFALTFEDLKPVGFKVFFGFGSGSGLSKSLGSGRVFGGTRHITTKFHLFALFKPTVKKCTLAPP